MPLKTVELQHHPFHVEIKLNRPEQYNCLDTLMLAELHEVLNAVAVSTEHHIVVIESSSSDVFCAGMDLKELALRFITQDQVGIHGWAVGYMALLKRFTTLPQIVIAKVDGKVVAGGIGIVAASDLVISSPKTLFKLSEIQWGLLPAIVTPFLMRRIGFQATYKMALTTATLSAQEAHQLRLIDEIYPNLTQGFEQRLAHFQGLPPETIRKTKNYFGQFAPITHEVETAAVEEITHLLMQPHVQDILCKREGRH